MATTTALQLSAGETALETRLDPRQALQGSYKHCCARQHRGTGAGVIAAQCDAAEWRLHARPCAVARELSRRAAEARRALAPRCCMRTSARVHIPGMLPKHVTRPIEARSASQTSTGRKSHTAAQREERKNAAGTSQMAARGRRLWPWPWRRTPPIAPQPQTR